jgi:ABC-type sugar transport system ATPase subunit
MVPEDRKAQAIHTQLSVQSNITLANLQEYTRTGIIQTKQEGISVDEHIQRLHIVPPDPEKKAQYLSGGNQQKVVLAKALDTDAEILFLDEPTAGIDIGAKAEIRSLINQLAEQGKTILLVSSDIHDVLELANRVLVMREGKLVGEIMRSDATSENIMHMAMTGEDQ